MQTEWKRLRYAAAMALSPYPRLYLPIVRLGHRWRTTRRGPGASAPPVESGTEIVIEGFPRSANTFAVAAFEMAQDRPVRVAHHRHAAAQVLGGIASGIPVLVLIREPAAAVTSFVIREPYVTLPRALRDYMRFHRAIAPHADDVVVATFDQVVEDFGAVIRRVNLRYGTSFAEFEHTSENVQRCFEAIEAHERDGLDDEARLVAITGRPAPEREDLKRQFLGELESPALAARLREAEDLYRRLVPAAAE